jgi:hypothetical protein
VNQPTNNTAALTRSATIDLLRGMLTRIEDVTPAGLHYLMDKVLPLLRQEALDPTWRCPACEVEVITRSLNELEHEASRVAPDASAFGHKAQRLVDVLAV